MGKFTVLFGAGVEGCFHLPLGSDYTKDTILTKKDNLYETLRKFYNKRETESYSQKYKAEYLFRNGKSHTLCQLVARAARDLRDNAERPAGTARGNRLHRRWSSQRQDCRGDGHVDPLSSQQRGLDCRIRRSADVTKYPDPDVTR